MIGKNMKCTFKLMLIFLIFFSYCSFAQMVSTETSPPEPIANESFFITFRVKASGDTEPYISFNPVGAQVLGKREQGVSIQTTVINGKFTSTKEQNIVYELISERSGIVYLRNIKIDIGGKITPVKDIQINVLSTPKKIPEAFMEAQVSKTKVYVGEGIDVNYYLYFKSSIAANDVKDFPKLNKFIKRFHHINSPVETVQYKNEVLKRILAYSARVYPEKVGTAIIDPMKISVQVIENEYNGFGFGSQRYKNKDLSSNRVEIEVMPLPTEGVPAGFTGLVGEHEFNLIPGKSKYLVNEPIEFKLEVSGKGALEKMDAPGIYTDPNLETFDTKSEVTEVGTSSAKKIFEYTFLARNSLTIPTKELSLSYFDPNSGKYIEKKLSIPGIEVSGVAPAGTGADNKVAINNSNEKNNNELISASFFENWINKWFGGNSNLKEKSKGQVELGLVGPIFKSKPGIIERNKYNLFNLILLVLLIIFGIYWLKGFNSDQLSSITVNKEAKNLYRALKKSGIDHSKLYQILAMLDKKNKMSGGGYSIYEVLKESDLSIEAKAYFKNALESCESSVYAVNKLSKKVDFESKFFNELIKNI
jgi:hypothetical protein